MEASRSPARTAGSIAVGVVGFLLVNLAVGIAANPRFPNEEGPMPRWLPLVMLALVVGLAVLAARSPRWRRIAAGFVLGYVLMTLQFDGALTSSWSVAATRLDPMREPARRRREDAARDSTRADGRRRYVAMMSSADGRNTLSRRALEAMRCAFAYRALHPSAGFPVTLEELGLGGGDCAGYRDGGWRIEGTPRQVLAPQPRQTATPVTRLSLRTTPDPRLMGAVHPVVDVDERGILTIRRTASDEPHAAASPVPALLELRRCVNGATRTADGPVRLAALLDMSTPACDTLGRRLMEQPSDSLAPGATVLLLRLDADSRVLGTGSAAVTWYLVAYEANGSRASDGFALRAWPHAGPGTGRSFLVAEDGEVHVTTERRAATGDDPLAEPCEADPRVACR
jgi:hypothetical protein